jgi:hypothetical protein
VATRLSSDGHVDLLRNVINPLNKMSDGSSTGAARTTAGESLKKSKQKGEYEIRRAADL